MKELYVFCEGQTEQAFCSRVLQPHFFPKHDGLVHPIRIAHKRKKGVIHRGGVNKYEIIKDDMVRTFRANRRPNLLFTSLIDLYALPNDFPGKLTNTRNPGNPRPYVEALEAELAQDIAESRFVSHLQLHEFETLIFAQPESLGCLTRVLIRKLLNCGGWRRKLVTSKRSTTRRREHLRSESSSRYPDSNMTRRQWGLT